MKTRSDRKPKAILVAPGVYSLASAAAVFQLHTSTFQSLLDRYDLWGLCTVQHFGDHRTGYMVLAESIEGIRSACVSAYDRATARDSMKSNGGATQTIERLRRVRVKVSKC